MRLSVLCATRHRIVIRLGQYKGALAQPTHADLAMTDNAPNDQVMCSIDLVAIVLSHAVVCPRQLARWRRVSSVWREACGVDETLLMRAARSPRFLTKGTFMGLFGLTSAEADVFEREVCTNRHGLMYKYTADAIDAVLPRNGRVRMVGCASRQTGGAA